VHNLYVAGSAAFATSSQANPTLTLIALSLRLGEHLARRLAPAVAHVATAAAASITARAVSQPQTAQPARVPEIAA
jgi:choline dehydrogenase-like flavoprotein